MKRASGASRERGPTHPRDGRIPARRDPTAALRAEGRDDGIPGAPVEDLSALPDGAEIPFDDGDDAPERLSPEEAAARRLAKSQSARPARRSSSGVQAEQPRSAGVPPEGELAIAEAARAPAEVVPSWSRHDLGFALQQRRSIREGVVRRTLRKLHIR